MNTKKNNSLKVYRMLKNNGEINFDNCHELLIPALIWDKIKDEKYSDIVLLTEEDFIKMKADSPKELKKQIEQLKALNEESEGTIESPKRGRKPMNT